MFKDYGDKAVKTNNKCEFQVSLTSFNLSNSLLQHFIYQYISEIKAMFMLPFFDPSLKLGQRSKNNTFVQET